MKTIEEILAPSRAARATIEATTASLGDAITPEQAARAMQTIADNSRADPEDAHGAADNLLCKVLRQLGYGEMVDAFDRVHRWYA